jgi:hypothetical protein
MTDEFIEPDEDACWFKSSATLRIFGPTLDLDAITRTLGLSPTHTHRRGDRRPHKPQSDDECKWYYDDYMWSYNDYMWSYDSPVPGDRPLDVHIQTLWAHIKPHRVYLMGLKDRYTVDVFCGYRSNCETAGIEVSHRSLEMFMQLEIPFGLSIIV